MYKIFSFAISALAVINIIFSNISTSEKVSPFCFIFFFFIIYIGTVPAVEEAAA